MNEPNRFAGELILQPVPPMLRSGGVQTLAGDDGWVYVAVYYNDPPQNAMVRLTPGEARVFAQHLERAAEESTKEV